MRYCNYTKKLTNGKIVKSGYYLFGNKENKWTFTNPDGSTIISNYKNNKKNGEYTENDSNGTVKIVGQYLDDLKSGLWKIRNDSLYYLLIEFKSDIMITCGYFSNSNSIISKDYYTNNKITKCEFYFEGTIIKIHEIKETKNNGYQVNEVLYYPSNNDTIISRTYKLTTTQDFSETLFDSFAVMNGKIIITVKSNTLIEGEFCDGNPCGDWKTYFIERNIYSIKKRNEGEWSEEWYYKINTNSYYSGLLIVKDGGDKVVYSIRNGLRNGKSKKYNSSNELIETINYKNGVIIN